jgi:uncharacterized repeat protein (TIGR03803 family)
MGAKLRHPWGSTMLPTSRFLLALVLGLFMTCNPAAAQTVTILYHFTGGTDGGYPMGTLNLDARGNIYGTATVGGDLVNCAPSGCGVVFELDPSGNYTVLHAFNSLDGSSPQGDLTGDGTGNIYGTAELGGDSQNAGVAFKLDSGGTCTTLHAFTAGSDGGEPMTGFLRDSQNNLYGTALIGGKPNSCQGFGCGLVFKLDSSGNQTVLHNFTICMEQLAAAGSMAIQRVSTGGAASFIGSRLREMKGCYINFKAKMTVTTRLGGCWLIPAETCTGQRDSEAHPAILERYSS